MTTPINPFKLFRYPQFWPYYLTQFLRVFNDNLFKNALVMIFTYKLAADGEYDTATLLSLQAGLFILPFFIFSTLGGQFADKWDKSKLSQNIKLCEVALAMVGGIALFMHSVPLLLAVLFGFGTLSAFFGPVKYSILPDLLKRQELLAGNGLVEAGTLMAVLLGTIAGGLLPLADNGEIWTTALVVAMAVGGYWSSRRIPTIKPHSPELKISYNIPVDIWKLLRQSQTYPDVWRCILVISWFWFLAAAVVTYLPLLTKQELGGNEHVTTIFFVIFSIGIAAGSILCNRLLRGQISHRIAAIAGLFISIGMIDLYWTISHWPTVLDNAALLDIGGFYNLIPAWRISLDLTVISVAGGAFIVPLYTVLQTKSPEESRARMIAANNIVNAVFMVATSVISLLLLQSGLQPSEVFAIYAMLNLVVAAWIHMRWKAA